MPFSAKIGSRELIYAFCILSSLSLLNANSTRSEYDDCLVTTSSGTTFRGVLNESVLTENVKFCSFLGIRYGQAPMNRNRFRKPIAQPLRKGVYNATSDGNKCLQLGPGYQVVGAEDCLFLNIFVPKKKSAESKRELKPVLVYVHGGAFFEGSSSSGEISPDYLIEHDIVMVTFNYRLNVFGFLNLGTPECGGNMGLRDQTLALEWIRRHIKSFGGDPSRVTVMGQSAGAISAHLLTLSPLSQGLFHQAIIHSAISSVLVKTTTESYSILYARHLDYSGETRNRSQIVEFLTNIKADKLVQGYATFLLKLVQTDDTFYASSQPFWPSEDAHIVGAFLPQPLEKLSRRLRDRHIPVMAGQTNLDGTIAFYKSAVPTILAYVKSHVDLYMKIYAKDKLVNAETVSRVKNYYFSANNSENDLVDTIELTQDFGFYQFYKQNFYRSRSVYNYQFCYDGSFQYYKELYLTKKYAATVKGTRRYNFFQFAFYLMMAISTFCTETNREVLSIVHPRFLPSYACIIMLSSILFTKKLEVSSGFWNELYLLLRVCVSHTEDLNYLFYSKNFFPNLTLTSNDKRIIRKMSSWWTNFVKTGNPNHCRDYNTEMEWKPTTPKKRYYLKINQTPHLYAGEINEERRKFLRKLPTRNVESRRKSSGACNRDPMNHFW